MSRTKQSYKAVILSMVLMPLLNVELVEAKTFYRTEYKQFGNTISGFVFDPQRKPVGQASVELLDEYSRTIFRTQTEGSGRFIFRRIVAGRYYVAVSADRTNYAPQVQEVEIINVTRQTSGGIFSSGSDNAQVDFYLRVRKNSNETKGNTIGVVFAQEIPGEARKLYEQAVSELNGKKSEEGIKKLHNSLEIFPDYFLALERIGQEYVRLNNFEAAQKFLTKATQVNPKSYNSWYSLGYAQYSLKQFEKAVPSLEKANEVSLTPEALLLLGVGYRQLKRYEDAEKTFLNVKKVNKGVSPELHWQLALLYYYNLKKYDEAAAELEFFLKEEKNSKDAEQIKALIKQIRDKAKEAKKN